MSLLAPLNQPVLVSVAGATVGTILQTNPFFPSTTRTATLHILTCLVYGLNVWATSQPGRMDGGQEERQAKNGRSVEQLQAENQFIPSPWAFAIWGPIFLGELVYCVAGGWWCVGGGGGKTANDRSDVNTILRHTAPGCIAAHLFQALWAASFRPKYMVKKWTAFVSVGMLAGIAFSLNTAHEALAKNLSISGVPYLLFGLPITLHFGWTTAASLVNLNGSVAKISDSLTTNIVTGYVSTVVATVLGVGLTLSRRAPVFGAVIAWALTAVSAQCRRRCQDANKNAKEAAVVQGYLSQTGAALSGLAAVAAIVLPGEAIPIRM